jgi:N5-(cytidine 5'-diphosphoramidyl)-L-glutamine hydrolase
MKKIVVSQRSDYLIDRDETRNSVDQNLLDFLLLAGLLPYQMPNNLKSISNINSWLDNLRPDGAILSGGGDPTLLDNRFFTEKSILEYCEFNKLFVLGLCRGMQVLAIHDGGSLNFIKNHVKTRHSIYGNYVGEVNSFHNHSISQCTKSYEVIAYSADYSIEAIRHKTLRWEGWMWHPERESPYSQRDADNLKRLAGVIK